MDHPFIVIAALVALSGLYVLAPVALNAFMSYRKARTIVCPEENTSAEIMLDAQHAALSALAGKEHLRVQRCSLWPEKRGCAQDCVRYALSPH